MFTLSLVIPCYNERDSLALLIQKCQAAFSDSSVEVILVDNGSTDGSFSLMQQLISVDYIKPVRVDMNRGYGFGILQGLAAATSDILGWTHADLQTNPEDVKHAITHIKSISSNKDYLIKGRRYGRPLLDSLFTAGMSVFETVLLGRVMYDINAQPTIFTRSLFDKFKNPPHDFSLDLYVYYLAKKYNINIERFPVCFEERQFGASHWNINWRSKFKFIMRTINYSIKLKKGLKNDFD